MNKSFYRKRRIALILVMATILILGLVYDLIAQNRQVQPERLGAQKVSVDNSKSAVSALGQLAVKGRAPKSGYSRKMFSDGWANINGCSVRELILQRDLQDKVIYDDGCKVASGALDPDPYTGKRIEFKRGPTTSQAVQIDHVVAVSDAWQKGAQQLTSEKRHSFYNDSLNLLAVDGPANNKKSDSDAATWLPPNKAYRCRYVARQVAVKLKYSLWVTQAEHDAIKRVLGGCPGQVLPVEQ